jgi:hypothetical protein
MDANDFAKLEQQFGERVQDVARAVSEEFAAKGSIAADEVAAAPAEAAPDALASIPSEQLEAELAARQAAATETTAATAGL